MTKISDIISVPTGTSATSTSNVIMPSYSTDEVLTTERWIDGKPIYRRVNILGDLSSEANDDNTVITRALNSGLNVESTVSANIISSNNDEISEIYVSNSLQLRLAASATVLNITASTSAAYALTDISVITEYTKITDTASSPVAQVAISTTSNVIMPSYSTEEVLTTERWVDGKPIYRITVDFGGLPNNTVKKVAIPNYDANNVYMVNQSKSYFHAPVSNTYMPVVRAYDTTNYQWVTYINGNGINVLTAWNPAAYDDNKITLDYTKQTDTASSPVASVSIVGGDIGPTEYDTGKRRGGKIVYGIEVDCGAMPSAATKIINIPMYDNSYTYWVSSDGSYCTNGDYILPLPLSHPTSSINVNIQRSIGSIRLVANEDRSNYVESRVIINYTK